MSWFGEIIGPPTHRRAFYPELDTRVNLATFLIAQGCSRGHKATDALIIKVCKECSAALPAQCPEDFVRAILSRRLVGDLRPRKLSLKARAVLSPRLTRGTLEKI